MCGRRRIKKLKKRWANHAKLRASIDKGKDGMKNQKQIDKIFLCACEEKQQITKFYTVENRNFVQCAGCGVVFRNPMPSDSELAAIYADLYKDDKILSHQTNQESSDYSLIQYKRYIIEKFIKPGSNHTDYGAGTGSLVKALMKEGINSIGIESSNEAREYAFNHKGVTLYKDLDVINDGSQDLFTLIEVIEHLPQPIDVLKEITIKLKPGGYLFITTPNILGIRALIEKENWRESLKNFHLVFYTKHSLILNLKYAGFSKVSVIKYPPVQRSGILSRIFHRLLQMVGLSGTLCVIAIK